MTRAMSPGASAAGSLADPIRQERGGFLPNFFVALSAKREGGQVGGAGQVQADLCQNGLSLEGKAARSENQGQFRSAFDPAELDLLQIHYNGAELACATTDLNTGPGVLSARGFATSQDAVEVGKGDDEDVDLGAGQLMSGFVFSTLAVQHSLALDVNHRSKGSYRADGLQPCRPMRGLGRGNHQGDQADDERGRIDHHEYVLGKRSHTDDTPQVDASVHNRRLCRCEVRHGPVDSDLRHARHELRS